MSKISYTVLKTTVRPLANCHLAVWHSAECWGTRHAITIVLNDLFPIGNRGKLQIIDSWSLLIQFKKWKKNLLLLALTGRRDTRHSDILHNDIQHYGPMFTDRQVSYCKGKQKWHHSGARLARRKWCYRGQANSTDISADWKGKQSWSAYQSLCKHYYRLNS
jgi:hypothetical protein